MQNFSSDVTINSSQPEGCMVRSLYMVGLALNDIVTVLMGQPVIARLLWITFTSRKTPDILNSNLALIHSLQYVISISHLIVLLLQLTIHQRILRFLFVYLEIGGPFSLTFICLERYVAVIHPTSYPLLKKYRCRELCAAALWLVSVPSALLSALSEVSSEGHENIPLYVMLVPAVMMVGCSIRIAWALKKSGPGKDKLHPTKRRAFKTVCCTSIITLVCYIPVTLLQKYEYTHDMSSRCVVTPVCIVLLSVASVVHPLFYISTHGRLWSCCKALQPEAPSPH